MAIFKLRETFANGKTHSIRIPAGDEATALTVGQALLDGQLEVLEAPANVIVTDAVLTAVAYKRFDIMGKNTATSNKVYFAFLGASTVTDLDVRNFFLNKTLNGVHVDEVTVSVRSYAV